MAEYTREQLIAALRKADAAGDTEAARAIARRIQGMGSQSRPKTAEELTPGLSTNPTDGMSGGQRFAAGAGKSLRDTGLGMVQWASSGGPYRRLVEMAQGDGERNPLDVVGRVNDWADERIAANAQADSALMDTGAGLSGNIAGNVAQIVAPGALFKLATRVPQLSGMSGPLTALSRAFMPTSVKGSALQGAVIGQLAPVQEGQSRELNTVVGAGSGAAGAAIPRIAGAGVRTANRLLEPFREKGMENVVGRTLQRFAKNPNTLTNTLPDPILGRAPTLAEATLDPGIAQLQRAAQSRSPDVASALFDSRVAANEGRAAALQRFAGTPEARAAAMSGIDAAEDAAYAALRDVDGVDVVPVVRRVDRLISGPEGKRPEVRAALSRARAMFFEPYEDAARIKDARKIVADTIGQRMSAADTDALLEARRILANRQGLSADEVVEQLSTIRPQSKTAATALKEATELVNSLNVAYESQVPRLIGVRKGINDLIAGKGDSKAGTAAQAELIEIRNALDDAIRKVAPGIDAALDARRVGMRPVNEMDTMTDLLQRATIPVPNSSGGMSRALQPSALLRPTEDLDALARRGTGFRKAQADNVLSPQAQEAIEGVRVGLARQQFADNAARGPGSPTAQYLAGQNIMDALGLKPNSRLAGLMNVGAAVMDKPYAFAGVPQRLEQTMARVLSNPAEAQRVLAALPAPDRALLEQALGRIGAPVGIASGRSSE